MQSDAALAMPLIVCQYSCRSCPKIHAGQRLTACDPTGVASVVERDQVMGHADSGVFQSYLNQRVKCHVQAAFLGRPSEKALLKAVGHMSLTADARAPTKLTDQAIPCQSTWFCARASSMAAAFGGCFRIMGAEKIPTYAFSRSGGARL